jgi:hypothetical protein
LWVGWTPEKIRFIEVLSPVWCAIWLPARPGGGYIAARAAVSQGFSGLIPPNPADWASDSGAECH